MLMGLIGQERIASTYNASTIAWVNAVISAGGSVSTTQKGFVDTLIVGLKADSLFAIIDRLWLMANADASAVQAKIDIVNLGTFSSVNNSPTFTTAKGYTGNGTSTFIDTGWAPSAGTNFALNSAHIFVYQQTNVQGNHIDAGANGGGLGNNATQVLSNFDGATDFSEVNCVASAFTAQTTAKSLIYTRTASNLTTKYVNGSSSSTDANAVATISSNNLYILARNNSGTADSFTSNQVSLVGAGAGLNSTQAGNLASRTNAYMTSLGTNVY